MINKMREQIDKIKILNQSINETTIAFDDDIIKLLQDLLENVPFPYKGDTLERATQLVNLHKKFIDFNRSVLSAEDIANRLFKYDQDILKYNPLPKK